MASMTTEFTTPQAALEAVALGVRRSSPDAALEALKALCLWPESTLSAAEFDRAAALLTEAGWQSLAEPILVAALREPDVHPGAGRLWSRLKASQGDWDSYRDLRRWIALGPVGEQAGLAWIEELQARGQRYELLRLATLGEHWLGSNDATWSAMAQALHQWRYQRQALFWVADWRSHPDASATDLLPVAEILRASGEHQSAAAASKTALQQPSDDLTRARHECWLAADEVQAGDFDAAEARLKRIDPSGFGPADRCLHTLVAAAVAVDRADAQRRPEAITDARESIDMARLAYPELRTDPARRSFYRRVLQQLSEAGGLGTRLWAWWRQLTT